jgi:hypothetical protein
MAIEMLTVAQGQSDAGLFNLPPAFDTKRYAAEWAEEGSVEMKKQRQVLPQVGATADGWEVWKDGANGKPVKVKISGGRSFTLMCRPRVIQDQVNALFGNVSKKFINREVTGETVAGNAPQDPGILTEERLRENRSEPGMDDSTMPLNKIELEPSAVVET